MSKIDIEDLLIKAKNKFLLVNAAAGRAKQIVDGSLPYVNDFDPNNPVITALREIAAEKFRIKMTTAASKKAQELLATEGEKEARPSVLERLAKETKGKKTAKEKKKSAKQ
ncbi:MAG: DNA-directed RNA polymerase subunit omega [Candidatus Margulisbacteria bacterium]|nr:DNA-directed RNA polymerase subunit omega [Candidatus Margulisiibacteriota bacterium]